MRSARLLSFPIVYAPLLGSIFHVTQNSNIRTSASQNSGIQLEKVPALHIILSNMLSSCLAHNIPTANAPAKVSKNPIPPSMIVFPALPCITASTGCLYLYDIPKSPRTASSIQRTYCTGIGSFSPSFSRAAAFCSTVIFSVRSP